MGRGLVILSLSMILKMKRTKCTHRFTKVEHDNIAQKSSFRNSETIYLLSNYYLEIRDLERRLLQGLVKVG